MKQFIIAGNTIKLFLDNGKTATFFITKDTGQVFYRYKIGTISNVKHPGICLGVNSQGVRWFIHNHYENGRPSVVSQAVFSKGCRLYPAEVVSQKTATEVVKCGLDQVIKGEPYHFINYNCQTLINLATRNINFSEDVEKWITRVAVSSLVLVALYSSNTRS